MSPEYRHRCIGGDPINWYCRCGRLPAEYTADVAREGFGDDCPAAMRDEIARLLAFTCALSKILGDAGLLEDGPIHDAHLLAVRKLIERTAPTPKPAETGDCRTCGWADGVVCHNPEGKRKNSPVWTWCAHALGEDLVTRLGDSPPCPGYRAKDPT